MITKLRTMDKRLRLALIGTVLLIVLQAGEFLIIAERNQGSDTAMISFTFSFVSLFFIPTSLILTGAVLYLVRHQRNESKPLFLLGLINVLLAVQLAWFAVHPCSWAAVFGLRLAGC